MPWDKWDGRRSEDEQLLSWWIVCSILCIMLYFDLILRQSILIISFIYWNRLNDGEGSKSCYRITHNGKGVRDVVYWGKYVLFLAYGNFWIGAKKGDFEWNWMKTKTEVERPLGTELTHWRAGEPQHGFHNKFCAYMLESGRLGVSWDDGWCTNKFKVICQKNV